MIARAIDTSRMLFSQRMQERIPVLQIVALIALFIYGSATIEGYSSKPSIYAMLVLASFLGVAAGGQTACILIGGMDLSMPAVISLSNIATAKLSGNGWSFILILLLVLGAAGLLGATAGYIAHRFNIASLIVTLGVGSVVGGAALIWTKGQATGAAPQWLSNFVSPARETFGIGIPPVVVFWIVFAILVTFILARTPIGRRVYATGANERAARLALVKTRRVWMGVFAASAMCAATTGILLAGFTTTGLFNVGDPYLFTSIAAVVIGGTSLLGARGDYLRTILGALVLTQLSTLLVGNGPALTQIVTGGAIIAVVTIYGREAHVRDRI